MNEKIKRLMEELQKSMKHNEYGLAVALSGGSPDIGTIIGAYITDTDRITRDDKLSELICLRAYGSKEAFDGEAEKHKNEHPLYETYKSVGEKMEKVYAKKGLEEQIKTFNKEFEADIQLKPHRKELNVVDLTSSGSCGYAANAVFENFFGKKLADQATGQAEDNFAKLKGLLAKKEAGVINLTVGGHAIALLKLETSGSETSKFYLLQAYTENSRDFASKKIGYSMKQWLESPKATTPIDSAEFLRELEACAGNGVKAVNFFEKYFVPTSDKDMNVDEDYKTRAIQQPEQTTRGTFSAVTHINYEKLNDRDLDFFVTKCNELVVDSDHKLTLTDFYNRPSYEAELTDVVGDEDRHSSDEPKPHVVTTPSWVAPQEDLEGRPPRSDWLLTSQVEQGHKDEESTPKYDESSEQFYC